MILRCQQLQVRRGDTHIVDDLNMEFGPGEFWGLVGRNGVGKSTLLMTLAGLLPATAGAVSLDGVALADLPRRQLARQLGMLQQHTYFTFDASVLETALIGRHPHLGHGLTSWRGEPRSDHELAHRALADQGLSDLARRSVHALSGGEARRLTIAMLQVQDPQVWLLDEPTNHLDLVHQGRLMRQLGQLAGDGRSLLAALHDVNLVADFCSHVLMLFGDGQWCHGPVADMLSAESVSRLYGVDIDALPGRDGGERYFARFDTASTADPAAG